MSDYVWVVRDEEGSPVGIGSGDDEPEAWACAAINSDDCVDGGERERLEGIGYTSTRERLVPEDAVVVSREDLRRVLAWGVPNSELRGSHVRLRAALDPQE